MPKTVAVFESVICSIHFGLKAPITPAYYDKRKTESTAEKHQIVSENNKLDENYYNRCALNVVLRA